MEKRFLVIEDIDAYTSAFKLSNYVWSTVIQWDKFTKWTLGQQYVEAIDSISANLAEGYGRYYKKDKIKFYKYSYGSLEEGKDWTRKERARYALTEEEYNHIMR